MYNVAMGVKTEWAR